MLYPLSLWRDTPESLRPDNGSEFVAEALQTWLYRVGIKPIQIYPGSPLSKQAPPGWENGYNERFNGMLRLEVLKAEWFTSIEQALVVIIQWRRQNIQTRPHQAPNMCSPVPEVLHRSRS
ncbi:MAG: integrase core domain-containing protein [Pseudomonadota bacterium]